MSDIENNLQKILAAVHGKDVRQAIHDSIHDCYEDGKAGSTDLVARERISEIVTESTGILSGYSVQTENITLGTLNQSGDKYNYTGSKTFANDVTIIDVVAYSSGYGAGIPISYKYENRTLTATATVTYAFQNGIDATIVYLQSEPISLTELTDIRVGEDGTVYDTAGDAVREQIASLKDQIAQNSGLTESIKQALMDLANHVAFSNDQTGQTYIDALQSALYPPTNLSSISAVYTQSDTIYTTDSLDRLKTDLVVTATFSDSTTAIVSTYTLSGTLTEGQSTITVNYGGKSATFVVTVTESSGTRTLLYNWDFKTSLTDTVKGKKATLSAGESYSTPTRNSTGVHFTQPTQRVYLGMGFNLSGKTIEYDVTECDFAGDSNYHIRQLVCSNGSGSTGYGMSPLVYRAGTGWSIYGYSSASGSKRQWGNVWGNNLGVNVMANKTVKIVIGSDANTVSLYIGGTLIGTQTGQYFDSRGQYLMFGGMGTYDQTKGDQCYNLTLTGLRIYSN